MREADEEGLLFYLFSGKGARPPTLYEEKLHLATTRYCCPFLQQMATDGESDALEEKM